MVKAVLKSTNTFIFTLENAPAAFGAFLETYAVHPMLVQALDVLETEPGEYVVPYVPGAEHAGKQFYVTFVAQVGQYRYTERIHVQVVPATGEPIRYYKKVETKALTVPYMVLVNEKANISYPGQIIDGKEEPAGKFFSLDGFTILDGTYVLAPNSEDAHTIEIGWWGCSMSDNSGNFAEPYPMITLALQKSTIAYVKLVGDSKRNEYPTDFTIRFHTLFDEVVKEIIVTDNASVVYENTFPEPIHDVTRIEIELHSWNSPGRQAKIVEFTLLHKGNLEYI